MLVQLRRADAGGERGGGFVDGGYLRGAVAALLDVVALPQSGWLIISTPKGDQFVP